jgi:uncharacterized protein YwqG
MSILINTRPTHDPLFAQSKWWGEPDMPSALPYPELTLTDDDGTVYQDPLTFICQIRLQDIAELDPKRLLPHDGMLWFFGALDYFLGDIDAPSYPGMGEWQNDHFRVLYSSDLSQLHTHHTTYPDGTPANPPAEEIIFNRGDDADGHRLLGMPYLEEVREAMPNHLSLLQIDEDDRWQLTFHDCGTLNFLISAEDLSQRHFNRTRCYLHSF